MNTPKQTKPQAIERPKMPTGPVILERGLLGEKKFESEEIYQAWKAQPWWKRLFS